MKIEALRRKVRHSVVFAVGNFYDLDDQAIELQEMVEELREMTEADDFDLDAVAELSEAIVERLWYVGGDGELIDEVMGALQGASDLITSRGEC